MVGTLVSTFRTTVVVALLPAASVTVTVMLYWPTPSNVPAAGLWLTVREPAAVQLSEATTWLVTSGTTPWQFAPAVTVTRLGALVVVGAVVSATLRTTVVVALLPAASVTVTIMLYWPTPSSVPAVGLWLMVREPAAVQLSEATTWPVTSGTVPWQFAPAGAVTRPGALVMVGAVVSTILRTTVVVALLPAASVTVTMMLYWPTPSSVPAVGLWLMVREPAAVQLSEATTWPVTLGTEPWQFAPAGAVTRPGALVMVGAVVVTAPAGANC